MRKKTKAIIFLFVFCLVLFNSGCVISFLATSGSLPTTDAIPSSSIADHLVLSVASTASAQSIYAVYHPRIIINRDLNPQALKNKANGSMINDFNSLKGKLDNSITTWNLCDQSENSLISTVYAFGYMYQMTGDSKYADKLIDNYLLACSWGSGNTDEPAFGLEAAAISFDWVYDRIVARDSSTPGLKQQIINKIKSKYNTLADDDNFFRQEIREADFHNYVTEIINSYLTAGLALSGEDAAAPAMISRGWGMLAQGYDFQPTAFGETVQFKLKASIDMTDGAINWEGSGYWRNAVPEILRAIEAYDTATNRESNIWQNLFANTINAGYYKIYTLRPDKTMPGLGDSNTGTTLSWKDNFGLVILLDRFKDGYIKQLIDGNTDWYGGYGTGSVFKLLFYDPNIPVKPFNGLPPSRQFGRDIVMRSGWGPSDTFMTFSAGFSGVYHNHLDDNSFTIFKNADLATDGGYDGSSEANSYRNNYFKRTIAHNAITVFDSDEIWRDTNTIVLSNDGGQRWTFRRYNPPFAANEYGINRLWSGTILFDPQYQELFVTANKIFESQQAYDYIKSDATKAYTNQWSGQGSNTNNRVSKAQREFVYLRPNYVIVFDKVTSTNVNFKKSWLLHSLNAPKIKQNNNWVTPSAGITDYNNASEIRINNGAGQLFVKNLLPLNSEIQTIGGSGHEGWVNGQNYWYSGVSSSAGKWRFEIKPVLNQTADIFLNILYPANSTVNSMPATTRIDASSGNMTGALILDSLSPCIVMFNKKDTPVSEAVYNATYTANLKGNHLISGLIPNTVYKIYQNGVKLAEKISSDKGIVYFGANGGSNFALSTSDKIPPQTTYNQADINQDNKVNLSDFTALLSDWHKTSNFSNQRSDINKDGIVNLKDLSIIMRNWGL